MTNPKHTSSDLVEWCSQDLPCARYQALEAENERLRGALDAVWKEATTMRNASKLVGPHPTNPADNRIWARSMYHAGKRIMEMLKPARAALGETK